MRAFQRIGAFLKPTTRFIQVFGHYANRSVIDVKENELRWLVKGNHLNVKMRIENGYVIVKSNGIIVGLGLLIGDKIRIQVPKKDIKNLKMP